MGIQYIFFVAFLILQTHLNAMVGGGKFWASTDVPATSLADLPETCWDESTPVSSVTTSAESTPTPSPRKNGKKIHQSPRKQQSTRQALQQLQPATMLALQSLLPNNEECGGYEFTSETILRYFIQEEQSSVESIDHWFSCAQEQLKNESLEGRKMFLKDICEKYKYFLPQTLVPENLHSLEKSGVNARRLLAFLYKNNCEEVQELVSLLDTVYLYTQDDDSGYHVIDPQIIRNAPKIVFENNETGMSGGFWTTVQGAEKFSSFFPRDWNSNDVTQAVREAFHHPVVTKNSRNNGIELIGKTIVGMYIHMFVRDDIEVQPFPLYTCERLDQIDHIAETQAIIAQNPSRILFELPETHEVVVDIAPQVFAEQAFAQNVPADKLRGYYVVVPRN